MTKRPVRTILPVVAILMTTLSAPVLAQSMPGGMGGGGMDGGGMGDDGGMGDGGMGRGGMGGGHHGGGRRGGSEGSERHGPEGPKPIKRERFDKIVTEMFRTADTNRDGTVTLAELSALFAARREKIIDARFAEVDANRDGSISKAEFVAWQNTMGSAAISDAAATGERDGPIAESIMPDLGEARGLAAVIEPLNATVIATANTNYDAGMSLQEFLVYEDKLFDAADTDHDGALSSGELRAKRGDGGRMRGREGDFGGRAPSAPADN